MKPAGHRLPLAALRAVAGPASNPAANSLLRAARRSRDLLLLRAMLDAAAERRHPDAPLAFGAMRFLARAQRDAPRAVATVLHYPAVGAWLLETLRALRDGRPATPGGLAEVAAAVAVRARLPADLDLSGGGPVRLPTLGTAVLREEPGPVRLRSGPGGARVETDRLVVPIPADPHRTAGHWRGLPVLSATGVAGERIEVVLDQLDLPGIVCDDVYAEPVALAWQRALATGWELLTTGHRVLAGDAADLLRVLVPIRLASGRAAATPAAAFGCVALSRPPDDATFVLALAHELQHVKLTALTDLAPLVDTASRRRFYVPWRADPRPAIGVLHGVHAHVGVVGFWRRRLEEPTAPHATSVAQVEFARWRSATFDAARVLAASGLLTGAGQVFVAEMLRMLRQWLLVPVPLLARRMAARLNRVHRQAWLATSTGRVD